MSNSLSIRPIELPQPGFGELADEAVAEEHWFLERMAVEWSNGANRFSGRGEQMLGVFDGNRIIAVGGLNCCPYSEDACIGRLRHLYVLRAYRNRGIAGNLIEEVLSLAGENFDVVRLRTCNPAAIALYEKYGFICSSHPQASHEIKPQTSP